MKIKTAKPFLLMAACMPALLICTSAWAGEPLKLRLDLSAPIELSYLIQYRQFNLDRFVLIYGSRPADDRAATTSQVHGKKMETRDWLLEDGPTAIWVTGVAGPAHHERILLRARLQEQDGRLTLQGHQLIAIGSQEKTKVVLRPGNYLFYDLPGSKSHSSQVELAGSSIQMVHYDPVSSVILLAVGPGVTRMRIYTQWWRDTERRFLSEYELVVE